MTRYTRKSGAACPECGERAAVRSTRRGPDKTIRYHQCGACGKQFTTMSICNFSRLEARTRLKTILSEAFDLLKYV